MPNQLPTLLARDYIDWAGAEAAGFGLARGLVGDEMWVENTDPVLRKRGSDERYFRQMRLTDYTIESALLDRRAGLLAEDWAFVAGRRVNHETGQADPPTRLAHELAAFAQVVWDRIPDNDVVLEQAWNCIPYGWMPMRVRWIGRGARPLSFRGRSDWVGIDRIAEAHPWHYAYTTPGKYLVYTQGNAAGLGWHVFNSREDQLRHWIPRYGSTSTPYGRPLLSAVDVLYQVKSLFFKAFSTGMTRSTGMMKVKTPGTATGVTITPSKWQELQADIKAIFGFASVNNAIVEPPGYTIDTMTDLLFQEGWLGAIKHLEDWITRLLNQVLMSNLGGDGNTSGSRAAWQVLNSSQSKLYAADGRRIFGGAVTTLIRQVIALNYGEVAEEDLPVACSAVGKASEIVELAALHKAAAGSGVGVDWARVFDAKGVPSVEDDRSAESVNPFGQQPDDDGDKPSGSDAGDPDDTDDSDADMASDGASSSNQRRANGAANRAVDPIASLQDGDIDPALERAMREDGALWSANLRALTRAFLEVAPDPLAGSQRPPTP